MNQRQRNAISAIKMSLLQVLAIACSTFVCLPSFSAGLFGPEWTFTSPKILKLGIFSKAALRESRAELLQKISQLCIGKCIVSESGHVSMISNPEIYFDVILDAMVIEATATPLTTKEFEKFLPFYREILFEAASQVGLAPHWRIGGGHIHLGVATHFKNDPLLLRNFIVDIMNHPELFLGGLGLDLLNAPPLSIQDPKLMLKFQEILRSFDTGEISLKQFLYAIRRSVYSSMFVSGELASDSRKFQLINLEHFPETIEIRGFGPQQSSEHYLALIQVLEKRIDFLKNKNGPLPLKIRNLSKSTSYSSNEGIHKYHVNLDHNDVLSITRQWIEEAGGSWSSVEKWIRPEFKSEVHKSYIQCHSIHL